MEDVITLWTPVIISKLSDVQRIQDQTVYYLDQPYRGLEDVKIKIRQTEARVLAREVEIIINLDVLCLVRSSNGDLKMVSGEERLVTRIPVSEFSRPFAREHDIGFRINNTNLNWEGELKGQELRIRYGFDCMVLALQDQAVAIAVENNEEMKEHRFGANIGQIENRADPYREEKDELLQKIFCYERDITSLKKSIYKTENRNAALNRELVRYQQLVDKLQKAIEHKDTRLSQIQPEGNFSYWRIPPPQKDNTPFAARLKRMFITAL